jgi:hypothetical protein
MADPQLVLGVPQTVLNLVQQGLLERSFHDGLFPALQYRAEAQDEEWTGHIGQEIFMSRPGLLAPIVTPIAPGVDPVPQTVSYEQWAARLNRYSGTIDTHIPTSAVANADLFLRNVHQLGLQAGQSLNRIPRNELFKSYLSGQTASIAAAVAGDSTIRVASLNGFTDVVIKGTNTRPSPVSSATPLAITIGGVTGTRNVIGAIADNPDDPFGPGTLILSATLGGAGAAIRSAVLSGARPQIIRSGGGTTIDAIGAADTFVLQDAINATSRLRRNSVQPHEDGYYHAHISTDGNGQVFTDPAFQRLNTALPDHTYYREAFIGTIAGIAFFMNTEAPDFLNSGNRVSTGTSAFYSQDIGAETTNESNVNVGRIVVTGRGALYEKWLDEKKNYVSEAGITGKTGEFQVVNAGVEVQTERVRLILRAPLNRLQDVLAASWSYTGCFPVPSDVTSGGPERFKRAIVIEHALDS